MSLQEVILGIDPGSRVTGYGIIHVQNQDCRYVTSGVVKTLHADIPQRLKEIYRGLAHIIEVNQPTCLAIEQIFMHKNANSALKLGHARGAAMLAGALKDLPIAEYSPRQIKQAVVGYGGAEKAQIQHMVMRLLALSDSPAEDAADALAVALCHSVNERTRRAIEASDKSKG